MTRTPHASTPARELRKIAAATVVGTAIEWYDFFLYASAAGLVFAHLFFEPAGPQISVLLAFASVGVSFLFRPLGAFVAGYLGDRIGRRAVLVATLVLMGASTALIGLLPGYAQIGVAAPVLLLLLRILQGVSAGGEWGGAALMAVEHAPEGKRGLYGAFPQIGVPLGLLMSSGMLALMTGVISPGEAFLEWGWRVPFLVSIVLVVVGYVVRRTVDESPVFRELQREGAQARLPIVVLFRKHWRLVILAALTLAGMNASGYMTTGGYIQNYATDPAGPVGLDSTQVLLAVSGSAVTWLVMTFAAGALSDRIGRRPTYLIGWAALFVGIATLFPLVNTGSVWMLFLGLVILTIGLGLTYGQVSAFYAELFPAPIRFSGVSISYALGSVLGGAFAPTIATWLVQTTGSTWSVAAYLMAMVVLALVATLILPDRTNAPLGLRDPQPADGLEAAPQR